MISNLTLSFLALLVLFMVGDRAWAVEENKLLDILDGEVVPFYEKRLERGSFSGKSGITIRYAKYEVADENGALIILPGRKEYALKYAEFIYDLQHSGYSIYILDHRGQGSSGRLLGDPQKGHVNDFNDYVDDFEIFIDKVVNVRQHRKLFVVAHSMGCVIAGLYATRNSQVFDGMIFCSPMLEIASPVKPAFLTSFAAVFMDSIWLGKVAVPFKKEFLPELPFDRNRVTHSRSRYEMNRRLLKKNSGLFVGAPTYRWVRQAINAGNVLIKNAGMIDTPVLLLQAEEDQVVTAEGGRKFCGKARNCTLKIVAGARHEILMERDPIRKKVLENILDFLLRYSGNSRPAGQIHKKTGNSPS